MKTDFPSLAWWRQLTPQWKQAFSETCFRHSDEPTSLELEQLSQAPALRFAGPAAPYPNMSFELEDLSGISQLAQLEVLVVIYQQIESVEELKTLTGLKSLFLYNNEIKSLSGVENLTNLRQLYVQWNHLESITPVKPLVNLEELYIHDNEISSLDGLTEEHAEKLERFFCKPNDKLKQKELLSVEKALGIRCRGL